MAKIGLMGGTFNPIHNGHLALGKQALSEYHLDAVWFMPSGTPPHKAAEVLPGEIRSEMVRLAVENIEGLEFSDFELRREGKTYTAETLKLLDEAYPEHTFYFMMGADSLFEIETWYHPELILGHIPILVAGRNYSRNPALSLEEHITYLRNKYGAEIYVLHCPIVDIASKDIRKLVDDGISVEDIVPAKVAAYIREHGLYDN